MRFSIFGAKYKNDLSEFRKNCRQVLKKEGIKLVDESYFETTRDNDVDNPNVFKQVENSIVKSDAIIIELTRKSDGIGMILGMAYSKNKPTLILYNKKKRNIPFSSVALTSTFSKKTKVEDYTAKSLNSILIDFVKQVKQSQDSNFLVSLPSELGKYLNWLVYDEGVTKRDVIRKLLEQKMDSDKKYTDFIR